MGIVLTDVRCRYERHNLRVSCSASSWNSNSCLSLVRPKVGSIKDAPFDLSWSRATSICEAKSLPLIIFLLPALEVVSWRSKHMYQLRLSVLRQILFYSRCNRLHSSSCGCSRIMTTGCMILLLIGSSNVIVCAAGSRWKSCENGSCGLKIWSIGELQGSD